MPIVREYEAADGKVPFRRWLDTLDRAARARVQARILRFDSGNLGDGAALVLLLVGGSKRTQSADMRSAQRYWRDYLAGK